MKKLLFLAMVFVSSVSLAVRGEVLTISQDTTIPAEGASYSGIVFTGGYTLSGGKVTLDDTNTGISVQAGSATIACEVDVGSGSDTVPVTVSTGATLTIAANGGVLSGSAPICMDGETGGGTVKAEGANTFTGDLEIKKVLFYAKNDAAFGTADGKTIVNMPNLYFNKAYQGRVFLCGIDTSERIELAVDNDYKYLVSDANSVNVLRGLVTRTSEKLGRVNLEFLANSSTKFLGGLSDLSYISWGAASTAQIEFASSYQAARASFNGGTYVFSACIGPNNNWGGYGLNCSGANEIVRTTVTNAFCETEGATTLGNNVVLLGASSTWTFDLNGYDQIISGFFGNGYDTTVTSAKPALLRVVNTHSSSGGDSDLRRTFTGQLSLSVEGPRPLKFNRANTATGTLSFTNKADVVFGPSATWGGRNVAIGGMGTVFTVQKRDAFPEKPEFLLYDGGALKLDWAGSSIIVGSLSVDGVKQTASGSYGAVGSGADHELSCLLGTGTLYVEQEVGGTFTFNAAAGAADQKISTDANWVNSSKPNLTSGADNAVFAAQGDRAAFDVDANLYGVTFSILSGGSYTLADDGGSLTVGMGGLTLPAGGVGDAPRTVTNEVPTTVFGSSVWTLNGVSDTFVQSGALSSAVTAGAQIMSDADIYLSADNSAYMGTLAFVSTDEHPGCVIHVDDGKAMGAKGAKFIMDRGTTTSAFTARLLQLAYGGDMTIDADVESKTAIDNSKSRFIYQNNTTVAYNGFYKHESYDRDFNGFRGLRVVFAGGFHFGAGIWSAPLKSDWDAEGNGGIILTNVSGRINQIGFSANPRDFSVDQNPGLVQICTPTNQWGPNGYGIRLAGACKIECRAYQAILTNMTSATAGCPDFQYTTFENCLYLPVIDLGGYEQSVVSIWETTAVPDATIDTLKGMCEIRSAEPAMLTAVQCKDATVSALSFRGKAGLNLAGTKTLTMRKTASPTEGTLQVDGGKLVLETGAAWTNAETVVVKNAGALTLNASNLFNRKGTVNLSADATLTLGAGTENVTKFLVVSGTSKASGYYGSANCPDPRVPSENKLSVLSGTGVLKCRGTPGFMVFVR